MNIAHRNETCVGKKMPWKCILAMLKYRDPEIQNFMLGANHGGALNKQKVPKIKILKKR